MACSYQWYVIQVKPGSENTVFNVIKSIISSEGGDNTFIEDVFLPAVDNDQQHTKKTFKSKVPGYLFVKMDMNEVSSRSILSIRSVAKFLGNSVPKVIPEYEMKKIKNNIDNLSESDKVDLSFQVGDDVAIISGPFDSFVGKVESVDCAKKMLRVLILIFGRSTPVDLEISKVKKVE